MTCFYTAIRCRQWPTGYTADEGNYKCVVSNSVSTVESAEASLTVTTATVCTVTFTANGGSSVPQQKVSQGQQATEPYPAPYKEGHTFTGWYIGNTFESRFDFRTPVTQNITLYANWEPVYHIITFNSNGGSVVSDQMVEYGENTNRPQDPTKEGAAFTGWYTSQDFSTLFTFFTTISSDMTLYAKWEPVETPRYYITYNLNCDNDNLQAPTDINSYEEGNNAVLLGDELNYSTFRPGYTFLGWNEYPYEGSGTMYLPGQLFQIGNFNVTLYAHWHYKGGENGPTTVDGYAAYVSDNITYMTDHLKTTDNLTFIDDSDQWFASSQPAYCVIDGTTHYNQYALTSAGIIPVGWHIMTYLEFVSALKGTVMCDGSIATTGTTAIVIDGNQEFFLDDGIINLWVTGEDGSLDCYYWDYAASEYVYDQNPPSGEGHPVFLVRD